MAWYGKVDTEKFGEITYDYKNRKATFDGVTYTMLKRDDPAREFLRIGAMFSSSSPGDKVYDDYSRRGSAVRFAKAISKGPKTGIDFIDDANKGFTDFIQDATKSAFNTDRMKSHDAASMEIYNNISHRESITRKNDMHESNEENKTFLNDINSEFKLGR